MTTATITASQASQEIQKHITSMEALRYHGRLLLGIPSLEDAAATSYSELVANALEQSGNIELLETVDQSEVPLARVETLVTSIVEPEITRAAEMGAKYDALTPDTPVFTTSDQATVSQEGEVIVAKLKLDSLKSTLTTFRTYRSSMEALKGLMRSKLIMDADESVSFETLKPLVVSMIGQAVLTPSLEAAEQSQMLGELTTEVDRIHDLVKNAEEKVEAEIAQVESDNKLEEGQDFGSQLIEQAESTQTPPGVQPDKGTVAGTVSDDSGPDVDQGDASANEVVGDPDASASTGDAEPGTDGAPADPAANPETPADGDASADPVDPVVPETDTPPEEEEEIDLGEDDSPPDAPEETPPEEEKPDEQEEETPPEETPPPEEEEAEDIDLGDDDSPEDPPVDTPPEEEESEEEEEEEEEKPS